VILDLRRVLQPCRFFFSDCHSINGLMSRSDKAAEREKDNPLCEECFTYPTNHFCGFVLSSGDKCSKPVCGICCEQKPTRCTPHYWIERSPPKPVERHSATLAPKNRKIVTKKVLRTCSECKINSTPSVCVDCQVPVCTTCKLILNGSLGSYACSKHAKKLEVTFATRPSNLQGQPMVVKEFFIFILASCTAKLYNILKICI